MFGARPATVAVLESVVEDPAISRGGLAALVDATSTDSPGSRPRRRSGAAGIVVVDAARTRPPAGDSGGPARVTTCTTFDGAVVEPAKLTATTSK